MARMIPLRSAAPPDTPRLAASELAIFTGVPAFRRQLHVGRPNIGNVEVFNQRVATILSTRWLSNDGRYVHELEAHVAAKAGAAHCVALCNATSGVQLLARAFGLAGEVIVPSFTFVGTVHALKWQGLQPIFCDIERATHNLDANAVERLITERTSAILGVHLWGRPCYVDALGAIAQRFGVRLLYDGAHAFGCSSRGRKIGGFGDAVVLSFHATKIVSGGEGGAILTNDGSLAAELRLLRNFGFSGYDAVSSVGTNAKMSEFAAAFALTSCESYDEFVAVNQDHYSAYHGALQQFAGLTLIEHAPENDPNYHYVVLEVDAEAAGISRDELFRALQAENVLARRYFYPGVHRMQAYRGDARATPEPLRETERIAERTLVLPTGTAVTANDVAMVCDIVRSCVEHAPTIRDRLANLAVN